MNTTQLRITITAVLFLCIFVFGFWLSRSGKPYNQVIFTIHKLVALGAVVYLAVTVYRVHQAAPLTSAHTIIIALTALCFITVFVTGALLSLDKAMPLIVLRLHQVAPYLAVLSTTASLYLLLVQSGPAVAPQ
jgi:heme A synthase